MINTNFKNILIAAFLIAALGCNQDSKDTSDKADSSKIITSDIIEKPLQIADVPRAAQLDSGTQKIAMQKSDMVKKADLSVQNVTEAVNRKYAEIQITNTSQRNDTVFVQIPNASYLTQQSGTMGAQIYMAETTYSFTEIDGVNFVNFMFKEGDHASPGTFTRSNFDFKGQFIPN